MSLGYKTVQHVTLLNTVDNYNTMVSIPILHSNIIILYYIILYNLMGPLSYTRSVVERNVVMRSITFTHFLVYVINPTL